MPSTDTGRGTHEERRHNVKCHCCQVGLWRPATWTTFNLCPATSSCTVAHHIMLEDSFLILYSLVKVWGKESQMQSLLFLLPPNSPFFYPKGQIFLLRQLLRQPAQCGLADPHVASQDMARHPEISRKPNHRSAHSSLQEETLFSMTPRLLKSLKCLFIYYR